MAALYNLPTRSTTRSLKATPLKPTRYMSTSVSAKWLLKSSSSAMRQANIIPPMMHTLLQSLRSRKIPPERLWNRSKNCFLLATSGAFVLAGRTMRTLPGSQHCTKRKLSKLSQTDTKHSGLLRAGGLSLHKGPSMQHFTCFPGDEMSFLPTTAGLLALHLFGATVTTAALPLHLVLEDATRSKATIEEHLDAGLSTSRYLASRHAALLCALTRLAARLQVLSCQLTGISVRLALSDSRASTCLHFHRRAWRRVDLSSRSGGGRGVRHLPRRESHL